MVRVTRSSVFGKRSTEPFTEFMKCHPGLPTHRTVLTVSAQARTLRASACAFAFVMVRVFRRHRRSYFAGAQCRYTVFRIWYRKNRKLARLRKIAREPSKQRVSRSRTVRATSVSCSVTGRGKMAHTGIRKELRSVRYNQ